MILFSLRISISGIFNIFYQINSPNLYLPHSQNERTFLCRNDRVHASPKHSRKSFIVQRFTANWHGAPPLPPRRLRPPPDVGKPTPRRHAYGNRRIAAGRLGLHRMHGFTTRSRLCPACVAAERGFMNTTGRLLRSIINPSSPEKHFASF